MGVSCLKVRHSTPALAVSSSPMHELSACVVELRCPPAHAHLSVLPLCQVWETEAEIMDAKKKIDFYRTKMQEIVRTPPLHFNALLLCAATFLYLCCWPLGWHCHSLSLPSPHIMLLQAFVLPLPLFVQ